MRTSMTGQGGQPLSNLKFFRKSYSQVRNGVKTLKIKVLEREKGGHRPTFALLRRGKHGFLNNEATKKQSCEGNDNDLEVDRQTIEHGRGGFAGEPVAQNEMKQNVRLCGTPFWVGGTQFDETEAWEG